MALGWHSRGWAGGGECWDLGILQEELGRGLAGTYHSQAASTHHSDIIECSWTQSSPFLAVGGHHLAGLCRNNRDQPQTLTPSCQPASPGTCPHTNAGCSRTFAHGHAGLKRKEVGTAKCQGRGLMENLWHWVRWASGDVGCDHMTIWGPGGRWKASGEVQHRGNLSPQWFQGGAVSVLQD